MVESANQEEDRIVDGDVDESKAGTPAAVDEQAEDERAESSDDATDSNTEADDSDGNKPVSDETESDGDQDQEENQVLQGTFWKRNRLGIGIAVLVILVAVSAFRIRWVMNYQAQRALERRDIKTAVLWLQRIKSLFPNDHWKTEFLWGRLYRRQNQLQLMERHLRRAYELPGADILAIDREQTLAQAQNGQINRIGGDKILQRLLINHHGDAAEIANAFVLGYLRNHDYHRAHTLLDKWIEGFGSNDTEAYMLRARMFKELQRWTDAEKDLRQVLDVNKTHYVAAWELGDVLRTRKQTEEALGWFQFASVKDSPLQVESQVAAAHCLRLLGQVDQARTTLTEVLSGAPSRIDASLQLAMLEMEVDNFQKAVDLLEPLVKVAPRDARLRQNYGIALRNVGRIKDAQKELAYVNEVRNALTKARTLAEQMPSEPRKQIPFRYEIGVLHMRFGSENEAAMWFQGLLDIEPNHEPTKQAMAALEKRMADRMKKRNREERSEPTKKPVSTS